MWKYLLIFTTLVGFFPALAHAQSTKAIISGTVIDTTKAPLLGATVVVLQAKDSVLKNFALSDREGNFVIKRVAEGDYILQITFIGFQKVSQPFSIAAGQTSWEAGNVMLQPEILTADEVSIEADRTPILMKGDTIQYNADAFKTQPNAVVEDLLKKLPGVEVERDGTVKAQGETVQKVLVDGKEFFGDDPKMATKNLPADAVDNVQVFDKKSEMAEFTGVDDGNEQKTINLELKEDKKQGVFGNITAGYGTDNRYENRLNINRFNKKLQFSAIGMLNNTNRQGFSIGDYINLMGGMSNLMSGGGGSFSLSLNTADVGIPIENGINNGFVNTGAGGINFNYDLGKNTSLSTSYFFNSIANTQEKEISRWNFLNDREYFSSERSDAFSRNLGHRVNLIFKHDIDSAQQLTIKSNVGYNDASAENDYLRKNYNPESALENSGQSETQSTAEKLDLKSNLIYRLRFKKKGRSFSANASLSTADDFRNAYLEALNEFRLDEPSESFSTEILQKQNQQNDQFNYGITATYTEPLGNKKYLALNFAHQNYSDEILREVYDRSPSNEVLNDELSYHYQRGYTYNRGGLDVKINGTKHKLTPGFDLQGSSLNGEIFSLDKTINRDFFAFLPSFRWDYEIARSRSLRFNYRTRLREPSVDQLQPIVDNTDPLNVFVGNPELRPEYSHVANLHFMSFSQFSFISAFGNLSATYTQNKITQARTLDSLFRQTIQPINVAQDLVINGYFSYGMPLRPLKIKFNIDLNSRFNRGILFVNQVENDLNRFVNSASLTIENREKEVVDIAIGMELTHNISQYSVSENLNRSFLNQSYFADLTLTLGKNWGFNSTFDYDIYAGDAFSDEQRIALWQASLSRYFLKNRRGQLKLIARDILNQNVGFNRTSNLNYIQEERILSLGRYFMLSFTYNLSKFGAAGEPGPGGMQFIHRR